MSEITYRIMTKYAHKRRGSISAATFYGKQLGSAAIRTARVVGKKLLSGRVVRAGAAANTATMLRPRHRTVGTQTVTRTKRESEALETTQHNDLSHHYFRVNLGRKSKIYKPLGDFQYTDSFQKLLTNNEGFQGITVLKTMFTSDSFVNVSTARGSELVSPQTPWQLNPYQATTGGGAGAVIGSITQPSPDYVHCKSVDSMLMIQNQSNVSMSVSVVWYIARVSHDLNPYDAWVYSMQQKQLGQAAAGAVTQTSGATNTAGYATVTQYGMQPSYEKTFNKMWRKLKGFTFDLQGGGTRKFQYRINVNKTFSRAYQSQQNASGNSYVANQSIVPMVIMRPVIANINDPSGQKEATIAACEIGMLNTNHYRWTAMAGGRLEYNRIFPGIIQGTSHSQGETIVNDVDVLSAVVQA